LSRGIAISLLLATSLLAIPAAPALAQNAGIQVPEGTRLPEKWGIGITLYNQRQDYNIVTLEVPLAGVDVGAADDLTVTNTTDSTHLKFDYWLFPFLNVYVLGGYIDGSTAVKLGDVDLGLPIRLNDILIEYTGFMYGGGVTLAYGSERWFTSITYDINRTDLDVTNSSVSGWLVTPRVGLVFEHAAVYVGAMYQQAEETHEGIFEMPYLGAVPYYVELEQAEPWNYLVGMSAGLGKNWNLTFEGGFGKRTAVLANLEKRF